MIVSVMIRRVKFQGCGTAVRSSSSEIARMWYSCQKLFKWWCDQTICLLYESCN